MPQSTEQNKGTVLLEVSKTEVRTHIQILQGKNAYSETVPDVDEGFTQADMKDPKHRRLDP
jgi:hypothetical protein